METKVLVVKSDRMDTNKKEDRNENSLVRLPKRAREKFGSESLVEVWKDEKSVQSLSIFKAYSDDLKVARKLVDDGTITNDDISRLCFVSSNMYKKIGDGKNIVSEVNLSTTFANMLIGADPELLIMKDGKVLHANHIQGFTGGKFGSDGAMAEIRPDPATTPEGIVENMRKIFSNKDTKAEEYDWISTCYHESKQRDYPVGSHIHIGSPSKISNQLGEGQKKRLFAVTNKIMDEMLAIPMIRLDGTHGHRRRAKCKMSKANGYGGNYGKGYGFFGEWRYCNGRLEFRSLSGLVIANPELCKVVYGTALAIAEAVYKSAIKHKLDSEIILPNKYNPISIYDKTFKNWKDIPLAEMFKCTTDSDIMSNILDKSSRTEISTLYIEKWLKKMSKLSTFDKYESYIIKLSEILSSNTKDLNNINRNIKNNWRE